MEDSETIGQRIRRERLCRSMTQRDLANFVGVGAPHISKVEAGRENPSDELLQKIADAFQCDFDELLLVARRLSPESLETLATNARQAIQFLRKLKSSEI